MMHPNLTIDRWRGGKAAALSLTFDGWTPGHAAIAAGALEARALLATFFVTLDNFGVSPELDHWFELQRLSRLGHEVANKTKSFADLCESGPARLHHEIIGAQQELEDNLFGVPVRSFAYPYGKFDENVIEVVKKTHSAARRFDDYDPLYAYDDDFDRAPGGYYAIRTLPMNEPQVSSDFARHLATTIERGGFLPCAFQGVYNDEHPRDRAWPGALSEAEFTGFADEIARHAADFWIAPFGEAVAYHRTARAASLKINWQSDGALGFEMASHAGLPVRHAAELSVCMTRHVAASVWRVLRNGAPVPHELSESSLRFAASVGDKLIVEWARPRNSDF